MITREKLTAYALDFASFLLDSKIGSKIDKILLFGSVARGDFRSDSDIDLFVDAVPEVESEVNRELKLFLLSVAHKNWVLKGVKNELSLKVGRLKDWSLKREVLSSGVMLYGKYTEPMESQKYYALIRITSSEKIFSKQMQIWRQLYGYQQKVGSKSYISKGLIEKNGGLKLGKAVFVIPMERKKEVLDFLKTKKIKYKINELWSDNL